MSDSESDGEDESSDYEVFDHEPEEAEKETPRRSGRIRKETERYIEALVLRYIKAQREDLRTNRQSSRRWHEMTRINGC